jgi:hypothetical protein
MGMDGNSVRTLKTIAFAFLAYVPCWVAAHCAVMLSRGDGLSLEYLVPYFVYAWTFSAGELPGFIWVFSLALYVVTLAVWFGISRRRVALKNS